MDKDIGDPGGVTMVSSSASRGRPARQTTAKSPADVIRWIETTPHHRAGWNDAWDVFTLSGHGGVSLRIPQAIMEQVNAGEHIEAGGQFDTRMFRATPAGRALLADGPQGQDAADPHLRDEQQPLQETDHDR